MFKPVNQLWESFSEEMQQFWYRGAQIADARQKISTFIMRAPENTTFTDTQNRKILEYECAKQIFEVSLAEKNGTEVSFKATRKTAVQMRAEMGFDCSLFEAREVQRTVTSRDAGNRIA